MLDARDRTILVTPRMAFFMQREDSPKCMLETRKYTAKFFHLLHNISHSMVHEMGWYKKQNSSLKRVEHNGTLFH